MKKQFRLPEEFTKKWLVALRSGEYTQGTNGSLQEFKSENWTKETVATKDTCNYCCLGVAGVILGVPTKELSTEWLSNNLNSTLIPSEIEGNEDDNLLVKLLSGLNDGLDLYQYKEFIKDKEYIFREDLEQYFSVPGNNDFKLSFKDITYFIEDNCELYTSNTELLQMIYEDIIKLKEGSWVPDEHSCQDTLNNIIKIAKNLNIKLND